MSPKSFNDPARRTDRRDEPPRRMYSLPVVRELVRPQASDAGESAW